MPYGSSRTLPEVPLCKTGSIGMKIEKKHPGIPGDFACSELENHHEKPWLSHDKKHSVGIVSREILFNKKLDSDFRGK